MELDTSRATPLPSVRTRGMEEAGETAFALLDALWYAPVGIAFLDRELRFVQVNEEFARAAGSTMEVLRGRTMRDVFPGAEEFTATAEERLRAVVESGRPLVDASASSRGAEGEVRSWRASAYPVLVPGRTARGVCVIVDETTAVRDRLATLERARAEADRSARRLALLQGITAALSAAVEPADVAAAVVERVCAAVGAGAVSIRTLEPEGLVALAAAGLATSGDHTNRVIRLDADLPVTEALRGTQGVWIESLEVLDLRYPHLHGYAVAEGYASCVAVPLCARDRPFGSMSLMFVEARTFDLEERAFLLGIAAQCAQALDRARLFASERAALAAARRAAEQVQALQGVTAALSRARTPHDVAEVAVERATAALGADRAAAHFASPDGKALLLVAQRGLPEAFLERHAKVPRDAPLAPARAFREGEAVWLETPEAVAADFPDGSDAGTRAAAFLPLSAQGSVLGIISFSFTRAVRFDRSARELAVAIADQCGQALERSWLFDAVNLERDAAERDRALLDGLFQTAPLGIALLDRDLRFVRVNPVLAATNGATPAAHLGRTPVDVVPALPWDEVRPVMRSIIETGISRVDFPLSTTLPGDPDRIRHFLESWYPVRSGGDVVGVGVLVHEVTAERDAEDFQRHVLGIVGHDLRNPLGAVSTAAHLLARGEPLSERQARLVDRIAAGAGRMDQIVGVLLDYTQARGGRGIPVRRRPCDLAALCRGVADECEGARPGRTVRCDGAEVVLGEWDPDRLEQAISNLVSNALDYSPPDTEVAVRWREGPGEVEIEVANADGGTPIPPDVLARIFEPFRRGKRERAGGKKGIGLGLFIARAVVAAHGGRIDVRSEGHEIVFTIRLPRHGPQPDARF